MPSLECDLPGFTKVRSGKVREVFDIGEHLLLIATDRISAFDCILPSPIPGKGAVLNQLSAFWFRQLDFLPNHVVESEFANFPPSLLPYADQLRGRSMLVKKAQPLPVECVVRGYLAGSAWKEYQKHGSVSGELLPEGLRQAECLPEPLFTPTTKAEQGHDLNLTWQECCNLLGNRIAAQLKSFSVEIYEQGREFAKDKGLIIADTKFEFGLVDGAVTLIDECLTPDSSRFWPATEYRPGSNPPSFDKQFVRDYLDRLDWNKTPPAPALPPDVIHITSAKYKEAYTRLTNLPLEQ